MRPFKNAYYIGPLDYMSVYCCLLMVKQLAILDSPYYVFVALCIVVIVYH